VSAIVLYIQSTRRFPSWTSRVRAPSPAPLLFNHLASLAQSPSGKLSRFVPLNGGYWEGIRVDALVFNGLSPVNASRAGWHSSANSKLLVSRHCLTSGSHRSSPSRPPGLLPFWATLKFQRADSRNERHASSLNCSKVPKVAPGFRAMSSVRVWTICWVRVEVPEQWGHS
jgi:hypothetical protein